MLVFFLIYNNQKICT